MWQQGFDTWLESSGRRLFWLVLFVCCVNLIFFGVVQPYRGVGSELLQNGDFSRDLLTWEVEGLGDHVTTDQKTLTIDHANAIDSTTLQQCWLRDLLPAKVILSAESMSRAVVKGDKPWHEARIDLVDYDSRGEGIYGQTRLIAMQGDGDWTASGRLFVVNPFAEKRCVEISLYSAPGQFKVRQLSLRQAKGVEAFVWGRYLLLFAWVLLGLWVGGSLYRYYRHRVQARYLLFLLPLLISGILMPNEMRLVLEEQVYLLFSFVGIELAPTPVLLSDSSPWELWPVVWDLSKFSHLIGYFLLSLVLFTDREANKFYLFLGLLLLALSSECLQFFVPGRTPRLSDFIVDGLGITAGWLLAVTASSMGKGIRLS